MNRDKTSQHEKSVSLDIRYLPQKLTTVTCRCVNIVNMMRLLTLSDF